MNRPLAAALIVALALRLAFGLLYWVDQPLTHDEREYLLLAKSVASGNGFRYPVDDQTVVGRSSSFVEPRFGRAPVYPVFLAGIILATGALSPDRPAHPADDVRLLGAIKIAQALVGVVGVWLIGALAASVAGENARLASAWIAAIYPPLVWICGYVLSEALYSPLIMAAAFVLGPAEAGHYGYRAVAAGIVAGVSALTRPAAVFFIGLSTLWFLRRRRVAAAAAFALAAVLVIAPWTIRNYREHGKVVFIASEGGITFWTGNHPLAVGDGDLAANPAIKLASREFRARHPGLSEEALEPLYYREAFQYIASHPLAWVALEAKKFFYLWAPVGPSYRLHSARYYWASVLSYGALLPFAIAGAIRLARGGAFPRPLWLLAASAVLMCLIFFPQERFRIPVIDPVLIVCAACHWTHRSSSSSRPTTSTTT